ncbi:hypothetical protein [Deinococcus soli (ex Cha et al. 2016)]|uniref:Uncharacterized protein n=2 Tax=Deinococcus soli (ex Cha et al. 2016) TaxID=1309411 RepID=A0ACC6KKF8_9DEIO|nr:hypothetical protein [Deinococcus soli (ex Cha et al. 2016)]MDR6218612.1 hypothetical protein [Deinococcus soli (ex Cha et al. 2016)]MDR6328409.1 hypothetical protein [Deinococcus soli (ex Cha et al. 2016)]MDR6753020.1 hypothetical protein [Deinococcus soli (ex Cha et al. 2016)]
MPGPYTREGYLRAKVLDAMASDCHTQALLFASLGNDEMSAVYEQTGSGLHQMARALFPLYPHEDFIAGLDWARAAGFVE